MPLFWIMYNRDNIPGKYPNQPNEAAANLLLYKYLLVQEKKMDAIAWWVE